MSFDINPPSRNLSNVQATSKTTDGGAGNTGYFQREEEDIGFRYAKDYDNDSFQKSDAPQEEEQITLMKLILRFIERMIEKIKKIFKS